MEQEVSLNKPIVKKLIKKFLIVIIVIVIIKALCWDLVFFIFSYVSAHSR